MSSVLKDIASCFGINNPACTTDSVANMKAAIRMCEWSGFPCFAHTLNIGIQVSLNAPGVFDLLDIAKSLVTHFKHSSVAYSKLKATAIQLKEEGDLLGNTKTLVQEVPTHWNSCFDMLQRLFHLRKPLLVVAADSDLQLPSPAQWKGVEDLGKVLQPFTIIPDIFGAESYPTKSQVYPTVMEIFYSKLKVEEEDSLIVQNFKDAVRESINSHFLDDTQRDLMEQCAF